MSVMDGFTTEQLSTLVVVVVAVFVVTITNDNVTAN